MSTMPVPDDAFTVLLVFETRPEEADEFARRLSAFVSERMSRHRGFVSGLVYVSDDSRRVMELFQWARPDDWADYRASEDGREGLEWLQDRHPQVHYLELNTLVTGAGD
jgi:hypothetical protein